MISKLRDYLETYRILPKGRARVRSGAQQERAPLDAKYTYRPGPEEEWTIEGRHVHYNGEAVDDLLGRCSIGECCHLIDSLASYRDWLFHRRAPRGPQLRQILDGAMTRVMKKVHRRYSQRMCGMDVSIDGDRLYLNRLDVAALLSMFSTRPTSKARRFLENIQQKLALIIRSESDNPKTARTTSVVRSVYHELAQALTRETIDQLCLPARNRDMASEL